MMVIVELPEPGAEIGFELKLTVVPEGTPEADRLIALLKPPLMLVVIVDVPWLPCGTLSDAGEAEIVKFGEPPEPWLTPKKAIGVTSPVALLVPTTTVSRAPVSVTCWLTLLLGHAAADHAFPWAS